MTSQSTFRPSRRKAEVSTIRSAVPQQASATLRSTSRFVGPIYPLSQARSLWARPIIVYPCQCLPRLKLLDRDRFGWFLSMPFPTAATNIILTDWLGANPDQRSESCALRRPANTCIQRRLGVCCGSSRSPSCEFRIICALYANKAVVWNSLEHGCILERTFGGRLIGTEDSSFSFVRLRYHLSSLLLAAGLWR